jgi:transmembrane sensor
LSKALEQWQKMKEIVTERILKAYFENRATPHEKVLIKEWLKEKGNEEVFYHHLATWEASHLQFSADEERASERFRQFINTNDAESRPKITGRDKSRKLFTTRQLWYTGIAASLTALICIAFYLSQDYFLYDTYSTAFGMTKNILLEDGSEVTLNANSTLKVPKDLADTDVREVWLDGEAFFSITKKGGHVKFSVHTDNVNVEVLGTKFNVNNRHGSTEVVLNEGSVKLTSDVNADDIVYMKPGDFVSLSQSDTTFKRKIVKPEKYNAWQSNKLVFEDTPLRDVAQKIEDYYGVTVEIQNDEIGKRQLTGTLPNNDLGIVLKSLSASHNLEIQREDNRIIFR